MTDRAHHAEWLGLIDVSGPFLAEPVLKDAFPQGFEGLDAVKKRMVRQAYDEWREALDLDDPEFPKIHRAWIDLVLSRVLELDENGTGEVLKSVSNLPETLRCDMPERGISLLPDYAVLENQPDGHALLLIVRYGGETTILDEPFGDGGYVASPAERIIELCRGAFKINSLQQCRPFFVFSGAEKVILGVRLSCCNPLSSHRRPSVEQHCTASPLTCL